MVEMKAERLWEEAVQAVLDAEVSGLHGADFFAAIRPTQEAFNTYCREHMPWSPTQFQDPKVSGNLVEALRSVLTPPQERPGSAWLTEDERDLREEIEGGKRD